MKKVKLIQRLFAPNDRNGNPRRLTVIREVDLAELAKCQRAYVQCEAKIVMVIDEGYGSVPKIAHKCADIGAYSITAKEYQGWITRAKMDVGIEFINS